MRLVSRWSFIIVLVVISIAGNSQQRVLFLGNSITYDGRYIVDLETFVLLKHPKRQPDVFINVGLPSETVSGLSEPGHAGGKFPRPDLHERLARVLEATKPDVIFVDYGMNDGIYLPLDSARFAAYRNGMTWMHAELKRSGAKQIIILTPPVHDDPLKGLNGYDLVLDEYSRWIMAQQEAKGWEVGDLHFPMKAYLEAKREKQPGFKLAEDGVHPGDLGHWLMAKEILTGLGYGIADSTTSVFGAVGGSSKARGIRALVAKRQAIMKDAWLKRTGFIRPDMPEGLPFDEAERQAAEITQEIERLMKGS